MEVLLRRLRMRQLGCVVRLCGWLTMWCAKWRGRRPRAMRLREPLLSLLRFLLVGCLRLAERVVEAEAEAEAEAEPQLQRVVVVVLLGLLCRSPVALWCRLVLRVVLLRRWHCMVMVGLGVIVVMGLMRRAMGGLVLRLGRTVVMGLILLGRGVLW